MTYCTWNTVWLLIIDLSFASLPLCLAFFGLADNNGTGNDLTHIRPAQNVSRTRISLVIIGNTFFLICFAKHDFLRCLYYMLWYFGIKGWLQPVSRDVRRCSLRGSVTNFFWCLCWCLATSNGVQGRGKRRWEGSGGPPGIHIGGDTQTEN